MNNDWLQRTFKNASLLTKSECSRRCRNVSFSLAFSLSNNLKTTQRKNCRILLLEFTVLLLPIFFICGAGVISTLVTWASSGSNRSLVARCFSDGTAKVCSKSDLPLHSEHTLWQAIFSNSMQSLFHYKHLSLTNTKLLCSLYLPFMN
jgi:hypothetical protein